MCRWICSKGIPCSGWICRQLSWTMPRCMLYGESCPHCVVLPNEQGNLVESVSREVNTTLKVLDQHCQGYSPENFEKWGLYAVYKPFWVRLPYCNIFSCFTPDLLHQLHKGVFKDHLVAWCTSLIGKAEINACFKVMSDFPGLRHFKNGISSVTQWTGKNTRRWKRFLSV